MKKKALRIDIPLPPGQASYPFLARRDVGREYSDNNWHYDHIILPTVWNTLHPRQHSDDPKIKTYPGLTWRQIAENAIVAVWEDFTGTKGLKLADVNKHFIKELSADDPKIDAKMRGRIKITCKKRYDPKTSPNPPIVTDIYKNDMNPEDIAKIKGGDWVQPTVTVYPYSQSGGGVTVGLNAVRFIKPGEPFGLGAAKHLGLLEDIEMTADGFTDEDMEKYAGGVQ